MSNKSVSKTLAKQGGITFFGNIVGRILGFIFLGTATRLVSPETYGIFALALSIVSFFFGFANLSMQRAVDYFVPQYLHDEDFSKAKGVILTSSILAIVSSSLGSFILIGLSPHISRLLQEPDLAFPVMILSISLPIKSQLDIVLASFSSIKTLQYRVITRDVCKNIAQLSLTVLLIFFGGGIIALIFGYMLAILISVILGIFILSTRVDWLRKASYKQIEIYPLLRYTFPLMFTGIIYSIVAQVDFFLIGYYLNSSDVGIYKVSFQVASGLLIVISAITPVFKPMISEIKSDKEEINQRYKLATRWTTMLTIPMAVTLFLAAKTYLAVLFTPVYAAGGSALVALSGGYLLNAAFGPEGMILEGVGYTKFTFLNTLVMIVSNLLLNILFIPRFGITGAGVATAISTTLAVSLGVSQLYIFDRIHPFTVDLGKLWIAAIPMVLLSVLLVQALKSRIFVILLLPVLTLISYLLFIRWLNGFTDEDAEIAHAIDSRLGYPFFGYLISK